MRVKTISHRTHTSAHDADTNKELEYAHAHTHAVAHTRSRLHWSRKLVSRRCKQYHMERTLAHMMQIPTETPMFPDCQLITSPDLQNENISIEANAFTLLVWLFLQKQNWHECWCRVKTIHLVGQTYIPQILHIFGYPLSTTPDVQILQSPDLLRWDIRAQASSVSVRVGKVEWREHRGWLGFPMGLWSASSTPMC